jgi:hypothetical protein
LYGKYEIGIVMLTLLLLLILVAELEEVLVKAEEELQLLEAEKQRVARIPNHGPEFERSDTSTFFIS